VNQKRSILEVSILCNKLLNIGEETAYTKITNCKNIIKLKRRLEIFIQTRCKWESKVRGHELHLRLQGNRNVNYKMD
jgi:hypothetical protein